MKPADHIKVVREALRLFELDADDELVGPALAALDSLEAELAQARAELARHEKGPGIHFTAARWAQRANEAEAELAQAREERDQLRVDARLDFTSEMRRYRGSLKLGALEKGVERLRAELAQAEKATKRAQEQALDTQRQLREAREEREDAEHSAALWAAKAARYREALERIAASQGDTWAGGGPVDIARAALQGETEPPRDNANDITIHGYPPPTCPTCGSKERAAPRHRINGPKGPQSWVGASLSAAGAYYVESCSDPWHTGETP